MKTLDRMHLALDLVGGRPIHGDEALAAVLDAFESHHLEPDIWAIGEPAGLAYARDEVEGALREQSATAIGLFRKRAPRYRASLFGRNRPRVLVIFDPPSAAGHHDAIAALGDALAAAQRPDIGWLQPVVEFESPVVDETTRVRCHMDECCDGAISQYDDHGPGGLGARTWLGPPMVKLIGRARLDAAPVKLTDLPWGGLRVDLADHPLDADDAALAAAWTAAMKALADAEVFARSTLDEDGFADFERGPRFDLNPAR